MTPTIQRIAALCLLVGAGLVVGGVYLLAGPGWTLLAAGAALILCAWVLVRGTREVTHAE